MALDSHSILESFSWFCVLSGIPAVSVPVTFSVNGLPIGLQLLAPPFHEETMLRAAKFVEKQGDFVGLNYEEFTDLEGEETLSDWSAILVRVAMAIVRTWGK